MNEPLNIQQYHVTNITMVHHVTSTELRDTFYNAKATYNITSIPLQ